MVDLSKFSKTELCEIYDNLSGWNWDVRLGDHPKEWGIVPCFFNSHKGKQPIHSKYSIVTPICREIVKIVGAKELFLWQWLNEGKCADDFDAWYEKELSTRVFFPYMDN